MYNSHILTSSAILFLVFNRPNTTVRVFEEIRRAKPPRLYIAADGPRLDRPGEAERCAEVRRIATAVDWPCDVHTLFRDINLGCGRAVSSAITWFFDHEEEGIILEDDCLPDPTFFSYCDELLDRYRHNQNIMSISGNNFQPDTKGLRDSYYFSIYPHIWGWATWRRAWENYDGALEHWSISSAATHMPVSIKNIVTLSYWNNVLASVKSGHIDTWDYQLTWSSWVHRYLNIIPAHNLVSNIGFGSDATHTLNCNDPFAAAPTRPVTFPLTHPKTIGSKVEFDKYTTEFVYGIRQTPFWNRLYRRVSQMFRRN
jgi:hypothetical protein